MDQNSIAIIESLGLTPSQTKVYLSLLELGETTSGPIIEKSKLHSSVVYNSLNQLIDEGLASYIIKGKTKYFQAADPKNLISLVEDKKSKLLEIIPLLKKKHEELQSTAKIFSGWKGVFTAFNTIIEELPKGSEYLGFAAGLDEQFSKETKEFFEIYNRKRSEKKYVVKLIANETERKNILEYGFEKNQKKPEFRFVKDISFNGIIIFGDNILQVAFEDVPIAVIISSKIMAESFRKTFYSFWKIAKK